MKIYALYKGDKWLCEGTVEELSKKRGVLKSTILYYGTASYQKRSVKGKNRLALVRVE